MQIEESINLRDRVAIVTGASKSIGRAAAIRLAQVGVCVVVNYLNDEAGAEETLRGVRRAGAEGVCARADVGKLDDAEALVRRTLEEFGRLDILVCNAGVWEGAPAETLGEDVWDRTLEINLKGTWALCRAAIPALKERGWGRIIAVSSTAGQRGEANYSNYAASKGGQIAFVKSLAVELGCHGITVNAVAPGWVDTEMTSKVFRDDSRRREIEEAIPVRRVASPDDIALPILFLCTDWARHITGEVLNVNGGSVLCG
ncbi:MAG TPA: SDR family NAD(P)-dependent oxidoreductase [Pyrinomonadaceae bacterium]|jgi:3-oxoacyl-[acyl-carrier protein] reductase|nr:SDR family NAD(P)-dependent oxidoreductase [Pyrinomonadaceae bacterium]